MRLKKYQVAPVLSWLCASTRLEKVIESCLKEIRSARIARDMPAEFAIRLVGAYNHRQRVPAHDGGKTLFDS